MKRKLKNAFVFFLRPVCGKTSIAYLLLLFLLMQFVAFSLSAQSTATSITGNVKDDKGEPVQGVSVNIKGTSTATSTDKNGDFKINVTNENATLVFSAVGFTRQEVALNSRRSVSVSMQRETKAMDEVVVVGYGAVRKSDLTGSVSQIKMDKVTSQPATSVEQFLQGRASGVQITNSSGAPGSGITFLIRGANSVSGSNEPLVVVDGYPIETSNRSVSPNIGSSFWTSEQQSYNALANLNPNDIESVEILKDASATAIYGSRGANGVVLISTKRGRAGKDKISYNFRFDVSNLPRKLKVLNTADYIQFANEAAFNSGRDSAFKAADIQNLAGVDINWQDEIYRTSTSQDHQLSIGGGDERTQYNIIGGYTTTKGIIRNSQYDRGSLRANLNRKVSNRFKLGLNLNANASVNKALMQSNSNGHPSGSVVTGSLFFKPMDVPYLNDDIENINLGLSGNPLVLINSVNDKTRTATLLGNLFADYTIAKGLTYRLNTGANYLASLRQSYQPRGTFFGDGQGGAAYRGESTNFNYLIENTLTLLREYNRHRINAVAGYTWQEWNTTSSGMGARNFPNDVLTYYNFQLANLIDRPTTTTQRYALASYLGRINYSFDERYLVTFTGRADGSTRLSEGNKWAFFPSVALGWNVHNESFFRKVEAITQFKVRGSYGFSGNQSIGVGSTLTNLNTNREVVGGRILTGFLLGRIGNPTLGWETTRQLNVGADISFLKNRLRLSGDYYKKTTYDLLINLPIPSNTGFNSYPANGGEIENYGVDLELEGRILTGDFRWTAQGNISFNRNKVINLGPGGQIFGVGFLSAGFLALNQSIHVTRPGSPIGSFFGYRMDGIYQNMAEVQKGPVDPTNPGPGDWRFKDLNGDGRITADDREIIGNPYPKYTFGLTNDFSYKNLSLSVFIQGNMGQDIINLNRYGLDALVSNSGRGNVSQAAFDGRWRGEGTSNTYPRPLATGLPFRQRFSDFLVEDASFVRLKNVTLSYAFPRDFVKVLSSARFFVTGTNLLTFTNYSGYDPEVNGRSDGALTPGVDFGTIPQYRTFSMGFNVIF